MAKMILHILSIKTCLSILPVVCFVFATATGDGIFRVFADLERGEVRRA